jgi:hypothetical protein
MPRGPKGEKRPDAIGVPSREELLEARANIERELTELTYAPVAGVPVGMTSPKPVLVSRLRQILEAINEELAEEDVPHA